MAARRGSQRERGSARGRGRCGSTEGEKCGPGRRGDCAAVGGSSTDTPLPAKCLCVHRSPRVHTHVHAHALQEAVFLRGGARAEGWDLSGVTPVLSPSDAHGIN